MGENLTLEHWEEDLSLIEVHCVRIHLLFCIYSQQKLYAYKLASRQDDGLTDALRNELQKKNSLPPCLKTRTSKIGLKMSRELEGFSAIYISLYVYVCFILKMTLLFFVCNI